METKNRTKMGRPPKLASERQVYRVTINMTKAQYAELTREAKKAGLTLSTYLYKRLQQSEGK